jgi:hypothetical protein
VTFASVENNITLDLRVVLQFIGKIIQPGLLVFTTYIPELIELPGFGRRGAGRSSSNNYAEGYYEY